MYNARETRRQEQNRSDNNELKQELRALGYGEFSPEGVFTATVASGRVTYTFTPRMFFSGLVQYNSSNESLGTNLRLRWEYQPGSELFVVYNDQRDTSFRGRPMLENRAFVVKITRLFRF